MGDIFIKILNMSISASWMILAVILIRLVMKKAPKWSICLLWGIVAMRLVIPFSLESIYSLIPSNEVIPENITEAVNPHINSGIVYVDAAINPVMQANLSPQIGNSANPMQIVVYIASLIWCVGVSICLLYALISYVVLRMKVRVSKKVMDNVYACDEVKSPFILGVFRPVIYIPSGMDSKTLDYVTDHEKAHLKRGDHFWKPLGFIILSVYWFNPLCWVAYILLCRDIEYACDEKVIRDKDKEYTNSYSQALLDCNAHRKIIAACPLAFGETGVKSRIKNVLNYKKPAFWVIMVAVIACIVVAVCFLTNPKRKENKSEIAETISELAPVNVNTGDIDDGVEAIGDIDQNGVQDRIIFGETEENESYLFSWDLEFNGEIIYHGENVLRCHFGDVWYLDLDEDGKEEIFINVYPAVNSMPQTQYVALKKEGSKWVELENTDVGYESDSYTNAFPITVCRGKGKNIFEISCIGLGDVIEYDVTDYYTQKYNSEDEVLKSTAYDILYSDKYSSLGVAVGSPAAWGVWETARGTFDGKDCIIATHGIQGIGGKFDILGTADVYFKYDQNGKIRVLHMEFTPSDIMQGDSGKRLLMANGILYVDTGYESGVFGRCGTMDGNITKVIDSSETPDEDGEANFQAEAWQMGASGTIEVLINDKFYIFAPQNSELLTEHIIPENVLQFMATVKDITDDGYVIVEADFEIDDRFATRIEKGKTYKLSLDSYNPGIYVDKPVTGNVVTIACSTDIEGVNPGLINEVYLFSPIGSSPFIPVTVETNVSDWISEISLPEGYSFGEFIPDGGYGGCFLISPRVYNKDEESGVPLEWQYSGALTRISADNSQVNITYENGIPNLSGVPIHNHTYAEYISVIGLERSNMQWPAIMLKENHDSTGDYWYFWFVKEGEDTYYVLSLSVKEFSQEQAIAIAETVSINY